MKLDNKILKEWSASVCKLIFFFMLNKNDDDYIRVDNFYPSNEQMMEMVDISRVTFQKSLKYLKENKIVEITQKGKYNMIKFLI